MSCCERLSVIFWFPLHAESANCMQGRPCFAIYRSGKLNPNIKMEQHLKNSWTHPRFLKLIRAYPAMPLSGQSNLCDSTFKDLFPDLIPSINHENTFGTVGWWCRVCPASPPLAARPRSVVRYRLSTEISSPWHIARNLLFRCKVMLAKFGDNILYFFLFTLCEITANTSYFSKTNENGKSPPVAAEKFTHLYSFFLIHFC